jgi:hypothetical protein
MAKKKKVENVDPKVALSEQVSFFHTKSLELTQLLIKRLADQSCSSSLLISTYKDLMAHRQTCIDACSKLLPYTSPKLSNVEIAQKTEHRFVIAAPPPINDVNEWLAKCAGELRVKAVADDLNIDRAIEQAKKADSHKSEPIEEDQNPLDGRQHSNPGPSRKQ